MSYGNQVLLGVISRCGPLPCTLQKRPSCSLQFGQEGNMPGHPIERRACKFIWKIARIFPIPTSRNNMMNTFIIANITTTCKSLEDKSMLFHSKKAFILPLVLPEQNLLGHSFKRRAY